MFEYREAENFDIGAGYGEYEKMTSGGLYIITILFTGVLIISLTGMK